MINQASSRKKDRMFLPVSAIKFRSKFLFQKEYELYIYILKFRSKNILKMFVQMFRP